MTNRELKSCLDRLFTRAKTVDEFEYVCALLRVRGMESPGWDPLSETEALTNDLLALASAPIHPHTQARLALLLYCHLTEADAVYEVLENMLRILDGDRMSAWPFKDLDRGGVPASATRVVRRLTEHARACRQEKLAEVLEWEFEPAIRNAFFHSDYILFEDEFRSRRGMFKQGNGSLAPSLTLGELNDYVNRGLAFFQIFLRVYARHRQSYKADKRITGRFGPAGERIPITLLAEERGLYGFRSGAEG